MSNPENKFQKYSRLQNTIDSMPKDDPNREKIATELSELWGELQVDTTTPRTKNKSVSYNNTPSPFERMEAARVEKWGKGGGARKKIKA